MRRVLYAQGDPQPRKSGAIQRVDGKADRHQERGLHVRQSGRLSDRKNQGKAYFPEVGQAETSHLRFTHESPFLTHYERSFVIVYLF